MKHKLLAMLLILFSSPFYAQWWQPQVSGVNGILKDVYCITPDFVVIVGSEGIILKTIDGGEHWIQKTSGTTQPLTKVQFVNNTIGYAIGDGGTLLKTIDAGESWNPIATGVTSQLYGFSALNENTFYLSGDDGVIKRTNDGGATFIDQSYDQNHTLKNIQILTQNIAYATSYDFFDFGSDSNVFIKTINGGLTWTPILDQNTSSFYFINENIGFIKDSNGWHKTVDGGLTLGGDTMMWTEGQTADMFALNENILWSVTNNYLLCECSFFCIQKQNFSDPSNPEQAQNCYGDANGDGGQPFEAIHFATETTGYAVGQGGKIYKNSTGEMEDVTFAVNEFDQKDFVKMYPNPTSDLITISFEEKQSDPFSVEIADLMGKKLFTQSYENQNDVTVNMESFSDGVYFVNLKSNSGTTTQKLIKK